MVGWMALKNSLKLNIISGASMQNVFKDAFDRFKIPEATKEQVQEIEDRKLDVELSSIKDVEFGTKANLPVTSFKDTEY